jgi:cellulose synthase/poly-beta-1,6-N-acetylglucosamine synthase-like glycosyltransferase
MFAHSFAVFNNRLLREAVAGSGEDSLLVTVLAVTYVAVLILLSFYGGHRYTLLWHYWRSRRRQPKPLRTYSDAELPGITVQLPLYNEQYVVEGLLECVLRLDYPKDRLQIQVLDDSTDETHFIAAEAVGQWRGRGFDVELLHRSDRRGFKAGALQAGLEKARYGLVAIFDADFRPEPDFLRKAVHYFADPKVAVVQGRWAHLNDFDSLLTRVQGVMLDGHFLVEHPARNRSGKFFNFNGTAGLWRLDAIRDAGGWHCETLTEDLDLSYRAQLRGWKFVYDPGLVCPAELPVEMNAFKSQQHRWAKGSVQVMKKILPAILKSSQPLAVKVEAFFHLTGNLAYLLMLGICGLTLPMLVARGRVADGVLGGVLDAALFFMATASVVIFYSTAQVLGYRSWRERLGAVPMMLAVGIGLTVNQSKAVLEALIGHESGFVRTPKYDLGGAAHRDSWLNKRYRGVRNLVPFVELAFAIYFTVVVGYAISQHLWGTLPFLALFLTGFWYVSLLSLFQGRVRAMTSPGAPPRPAQPHAA